MEHDEAIPDPTWLHFLDSAKSVFRKLSTFDHLHAFALNSEEAVKSILMPLNAVHSFAGKPNHLTRTRQSDHLQVLEQGLEEVWT